MEHPIFILSCARSGSTLLRRAVNAHPAIAAPPELHLLTLGQRLLWTHRLTLDAAAETRADAAGAWAPAIAASRAVIDDIMDAYVASSQAQIWCEKSVTSVNHLDILRAFWPAARVVVLFRHAADVVASGLAAIAERPEGYDFEPYLAAEPLRSRALLDYWIDKTRLLLEAADMPGAQVVHYEAFVRAPEATLARLARAFGLPVPGDWVARIHTVPYQRGPGDARAYEREGVSAASVGRGRHVDWSGVPRGTIRRADRLLRRLGYPALSGAGRRDDAATDRTIDARHPAGAPADQGEPLP